MLYLDRVYAQYVSIFFVLFPFVLCPLFAFLLLFYEFSLSLSLSHSLSLFLSQLSTRNLCLTLFPKLSLVHELDREANLNYSYLLNYVCFLYFLNLVLHNIKVLSLILLKFSEGLLLLSSRCTLKEMAFVNQTH